MNPFTAERPPKTAPSQSQVKDNAMKSLNKRSARRKRGSTTAFFSLAMIPMIGIMALGFEIGNVAVQHKRLQNYVDSKAVAKLKEEFGNLAQQVEFTRFIDGATTTPGTGIQAVEDDGIWDFSVTSGDPFRSNVPNTLQNRQVPAFRFSVDPFEAPLLFGPLFNVPSVQIRAEAVAFAPRRDVVIVQDVSGSMCQPVDFGPCGPNAAANTRLDQAVQANIALVSEMNGQDIPGDRVGMVEFDGGIVRTLPLTTLSNGFGNVTTFVGATASNGGGTAIAGGLQAGIDLFNATGDDKEVERILILVGDGIDNDRGASLTATANAQANFGIHTYSIFFCPDNNCGNGAGYLDSPLPQGNGTFNNAQNGLDLVQLMIDIVAGVPMKLVR